MNPSAVGERNVVQREKFQCADLTLCMRVEGVVELL